MARLRWVRPTIVGTAVLACVAAIGFFGARGGYTATHPRLSAGSAWLASSHVGQLTLLDGSSAEVAAQVQVGSPGDGLDAVQQGPTAYAVNRNTGTLRRVDGATFDVSRAVTPIPGATGTLRAFAGPGALYALDDGRGVLAEADPVTLSGHGGPVSLAAKLSDQSAAIDDNGRLWVLDYESGALTWIKNGQRHTKQGVVSPGNGRLTLADGKPVVVDQLTRTAATLDPDSMDVVRRTNLDLRAEDRIQVTGSPYADRLYVVASRGVLDICELSAATCSEAVALGSAGADLGVAVETGGRVFVPDYTGGQVWIVDLRDTRVIAQPRILPPGTRFQLLTRDGVVFFNDPDSEKAGVIHLDGGVRPVSKYDPGNPETGLTGGAGADSPTPTQSPTTDTPKNKPNPAPTPSPTATTTQPQPQPQPGQSSSSPPPTTTPPPPPLPALQISASASPSTVGQAVTFSVSANGSPQPTDEQWDFGEPGGGSGPSATHTFTTARTYQVTVTATFPDGRTKARSVNQQVNNPKPPQGTLQVTTVGPGKIVSTPRGISCPPTCSAQFNAGSSVHLDARPNLGAQFEEFEQDCAGVDCDVTVPQSGAAVKGTFTQTDFQLTLNVKDSAVTGGGGIVDVSLNGSFNFQCDQPQCTKLLPAGGDLTLEPNAEGAGTSRFTGWSGACGGASTCRLTLNGNRTVTANFVRCLPTGCSSTQIAPDTVTAVGPARSSLPPARLRRRRRR
jgi:hypothetical protein